MKKIGILGGTFNPIHAGHLHIAQAAYEEFALDEVWFLPAGIPPHKDVADSVTTTQRVAMVQQAIAFVPYFKLCDIEIRKTEPCYSWMTLKSLKETYGQDCEFYFIIGEDSLLTFAHWVKPEEICRYCRILVARRPQVQNEAALTEEQFQQQLIEYRKTYQQSFDAITAAPLDISSSDIRAAFHKGDVCSVRSFLTDHVYDYILDHHVYQDEYALSMIAPMQKRLEQQLKPGRFWHTIGVMYTAGNLAYVYDYPYTNAMIAGLLHDCAKCLSDEERIAICQNQGIEIKAIEQKHPHLLHGKVGAFLAERDFGISDSQITHAIAVHTTGCVGMSLLDKIIFVADYIEPHRDKAPRLDQIRQMAYDNLDECVCMILEDTMTYLGKHPEAMDETTCQTYAYYVNTKKENQWK